MKITMTPPLRNEFDRAVTCDLFGSEAAIEAAERDWRRNRQPIHHFTTYCAIARTEALADYLPSERIRGAEMRYLIAFIVWVFFVFIMPYGMFAFCTWEINPNDIFGDMKTADRAFTMFLWFIYFFATSSFFIRILAAISK